MLLVERGQRPRIGVSGEDVFGQHRGEPGQVRRQRRPGAFQHKLHCVGPAGSHRLDGRVVAGLVGRILFIEHNVVVGVDDVVGREGRAILPFDAVPQRKRPDQPVRRGVPRGCEVRGRLAVQPPFGHAGEDQRVDHVRLDEGIGRPEVERRIGHRDRGDGGVGIVGRRARRHQVRSRRDAGQRYDHQKQRGESANTELAHGSPPHYPELYDLTSTRPRAGHAVYCRPGSWRSPRRCSRA